MASSSKIHFKFKSARDIEKISFDGNSISLLDLKKAIIAHKKLLKPDAITADFDLVIINGQTREEYVEDLYMIPKNTSVIVKRIPIHLSSSVSGIAFGGGGGGGPKQKFAGSRGGFASGKVNDQQKNNSGALVPGYAATEQEKIDSLIANAKSGMEAEMAGARGGRFGAGGGGGHRRGPAVAPATPMPIFGGNLRAPPPNYVCHKCGGKDHYIQSCPSTLGGKQRQEAPILRRSTGIPKTFLKTINPEDLDSLPPDQDVMVTDEGKLVLVQKNTMDWERINALQNKGTLDDVRVKLQGKSPLAKLIPSDLKCGLCSGLLDDAVVINCCNTAFDDECIRKSLIEDVNLRLTCPSCKLDASPDMLAPAKSLREKVSKFLQKVHDDHLQGSTSGVGVGVGGSGASKTSSSSYQLQNSGNNGTSNSTNYNQSSTKKRRKL